MSLQPSQIILLGLIILFAVYLLRVRTLLTDRIIYLVLAIGGMVLILHPDVSTYIANKIGIGRGTDLILYLAIIFALFHQVSSASRFRNLERQITLVAREVAMADASTPEQRSGKVSLENQVE